MILQGGLGIIGALGGGILGGLGSFFQAREQKKAFRRFRKRQASAISQARDFTDARVQDILNSPLIAQGRSFVERTFGDPGSSPLAQSLQKQLRVAQEARGLRRSTAGAVAEASSLAGFEQQLRQQLLPQTLRFGLLPEQLRQNILSFETPLRIGAGTGLSVSGLQPAPGLAGGFAGAGSLSSILGQGALGAAGGFQIGQGIENSIAADARAAELLDLIRSQRRGGLGGGGADFSTLFQNVGGAAFGGFGNLLNIATAGFR